MFQDSVRSRVGVEILEDDSARRLWGTITYLIVRQWIGASFVGVISSSIFELVVENARCDGGRIQIPTKDLVSGSDSLVEAPISARRATYEG